MASPLTALACHRSSAHVPTENRARADQRPWPAVPRPWTSAWWELQTTRTRTSSSWTEWMTRCWPRRADQWSSDRCPCAVTEDGDSWPGCGATDGRTLLSPRWSRSCGRGAEHLADPASSDGDDLGPGQGQPLELLLGERFAQRGAVPVDEVEVTVSGPPVDRPGNREGSGAGVAPCGDPLVDGHGRGDSGIQHRSIHFAAAAWRRRGPERPGSARDRSGGPLSGRTPR